MGTAFVPGVFAKIKGLEFLTGGLRKRGSCIRTLRNKQLIRKHRNDSGQSSNNRGIISSRNVYFPKI